MDLEFDPVKAKNIRSKLNKNALTKAIYNDNKRYMSLYNKTMAQIPPKTFTRMSNELNKSLSEYGERVTKSLKRAMNGTGGVDYLLKTIYDMIGAAVDIVYSRIQKLFGSTTTVHLNDVKGPEDINIYALSVTVILIPQTISRVMCEIAVGNVSYTGGMSLGLMALATMRSIIMPIIEEWTKTFLVEHGGAYEISAFTSIFSVCTRFIHFTYNDIMEGVVAPLTVINFMMYVVTITLNLLTKKYAPKMKYWCFVLSSLLHISLSLIQENKIMTKIRPNKKLISALNNIESELEHLYADADTQAPQANTQVGSDNTGTDSIPKPNDNIKVPGADKIKDQNSATETSTNSAPEVLGKTNDKSWWDSVWGWVKNTCNWVKGYAESTVKGAFGQNTATTKDDKGNRVIRKDENDKPMTELQAAKEDIAKSFDKLKNQLEKIWSTAKNEIAKKWDNAGVMTKLFFALGMFALMAAILYLLVKPDMFSQAVAEFNKSISNIAAGVQNAFKGGSVFGILKGLINIVLAPFKILFAALNFLIDSGIGDVIVLSLVFFTIAAGFIYYQVTKKKPWDGGEDNAASAGGAGKYIVANDYEMANYIFGVNSAC